MEELAQVQEGRLARLKRVGNFALDLLSGASWDAATWRYQGSPMSVFQFKGELVCDPRDEE